ncbi:hypothetical protein D3C85_1390790 [compost metagenome]
MPMVLVMARASDMKRSTPSSRTMPATGMLSMVARVAARVMKPEPVTPAEPLEVSSSTPSTISWSIRVNGVLVAWAMKMAAMV